MNYSFMSFSCPEASLQEMFKIADKYGYDGIEPRLGSGHKHGIEVDADATTRGEIKQAIKKWGKTVCCLATSCKYANPADCSENIEATKQAIALAADIGCTRIRVFGGKIAEGVTRSQAIENVAQALCSVASFAEEKKVYVCMETHDDWCDPAHVAEVIKKVNSPYIQVNWDIMHPVRMELSTMENAFETLKPYIKHVHFHDGGKIDGKLVMKPIGEADIDHNVAVKLLMSIDYDGFLSGEWINWEPYDIHLPRELATMKKYEAES